MSYILVLIDDDEIGAIMPRENKTIYAVLGSLTIRPMSAYDMKQFMKVSTNHFWAESDGQLYPTLKKCLANQLVTCLEEGAANHGIRKVYSITAHGRQTLKQWLESHTAQAVRRNEHLLKLFYGGNVDPQVSIHRLNQLLATAKEQVSIYEMIKMNMNQCGNHKIYWMITLEYGLKITQAEIVWIKQSIQQLESML